MKYKVDFTNKFKKQYKKIKSQGKDLTKLYNIIVKLANKETLDIKYKDHQLINDKTYKNCRECHIAPDWLLIYKYEEDLLVLVFFAMGSHSEMFEK